MERPSFTEAVRQELARLPLGGEQVVRAELAAIIRLAGTWQLGGGNAGHRLEVVSTSGAVARRSYALLGSRYGLRPELVVRAPSGVRTRTRYGVVIGDRAATIGQDLALLDAGGFPSDAVPAGLVGGTALAYLRGALLAAGSISHPSRDPHLEIAVQGDGVARALAAMLEGAIDGTVTVIDGDRRRVVCKSGERIGVLLASLGASNAFLDWDERRLRRQLRGEANRLANADGANLRRSIEASAAQVEAVEAAIAAVGWDALPDDLRGIALVRLANPEATLTELGELLEPAVGKSAVHRRLRRLEGIAHEADQAATTDERQRPDA